MSGGYGYAPPPPRPLEIIEYPDYPSPPPFPALLHPPLYDPPTCECDCKWNALLPWMSLGVLVCNTVLCIAILARTRRAPPKKSTSRSVINPVYTGN